MSRKFRILTAEIEHETNTFSVIPTTLQNFKDHCFLDTVAAISSGRRGTRTSMGAAYEMADKYHWELLPAVCATANPTGKLTDATFDKICELLTFPLLRSESSSDSEATAAAAVDGVLLFLHGAMVTESYEDAEGEMLARVRSLVGPNVPIIVTLDLHANVTAKMTSLANALIAVRTYPHIDFYERALQGAEILQRCLLSQVWPITVLSKRPQLKGLDGGKTHAGSPMSQLIARGEELERPFSEAIARTSGGSGSDVDDCGDGGGGGGGGGDVTVFPPGAILVVSICAGFTGSDILDIGPSVTVTVNVQTKNRSAEDEAKHVSAAQQIADSLMDFVWATKSYVSEPPLSIPQAIELALRDPETLSPSTSSSSQLPAPVAAPVAAPAAAAATAPAAAVSVTSSKVGPLVIADVSDNPGSGHYGDATAMLKAMIDANLTNALFYAIFDAEAVRQGVAIGVGNTGVITLGGRVDPNCGGAPLTVEGKVVTISDGCFPSYGPIMGGVWQTLGLSMLFRVKEVDIAVISHNAQLLDISQITSLGVDASHKRTIVVKSKQHFKASIGAMARQIVNVDGGGLGSAILTHGDYRRVRRPVWPLDSEEVCLLAMQGK